MDSKQDLAPVKSRTLVTVTTVQPRQIQFARRGRSSSAACYCSRRARAYNPLSLRLLIL